MLEDWRSRNPKKLLPMEHVMEAARRREQRGKGARGGGGGGGGGERFAMRSGRELYRGMLAGELSACAVLTAFISTSWNLPRMNMPCRTRGRPSRWSTA